MKRAAVLLALVIAVTQAAPAAFAETFKPTELPVPTETPVPEETPTPEETPAPEKKYIRWIDFNAPASLMRRLIELDASSHGEGGAAPFEWIAALAYLGVKCGGDFTKYKPDMLRRLQSSLEEGHTIAELGEGLKTYAYYLEAYSAVLGGLTGQEPAEDPENVRRGLTAYSPIAKGYAYSHYDDFGTGRSYGYKRKHLGHDLMALTGTPVIAVESGIVEELGWNQYGGWRLGIRSFDGLRYWYYAHLRQNRPYAAGLEKGATVQAGDVIGYVGRTGYSSKENTNGIKQSHLHWGLQIIFHPSQKDGPNQIWIDLYEITKLLENRRSATVRDPETKEHRRKTA